MAVAAEDAMWAGITAAARGAASGRGRLTDISAAIEAEIKKHGRYGIVDGYGGHGIGTEMHQDPHVLNRGRPGHGPRLVPGYGARDRADADVRVAADGGAEPTGGPSSPGTGRSPYTWSTRWRSSTTASG